MSVPQEQIVSEKRRILRTGVVGALFSLVPLVVVAALRGQAPWVIPYYHLALPIVLGCLVPVCYVMMPLFDGVLLLGTPRFTGPRAALLVRSALTNLIAYSGLWLFLHSRDWRLCALFWALSLPASWGILRRLGAYQQALDRIVG